MTFAATPIRVLWDADWIDPALDRQRTQIGKRSLAAKRYAAKRRWCLPSRTSSMIFAEKASKSEGWRLVISP